MPNGYGKHGTLMYKYHTALVDFAIKLYTNGFLYTIDTQQHKWIKK